MISQIHKLICFMCDYWCQIVILDFCFWLLAATVGGRELDEAWQLLQLLAERWNGKFNVIGQSRCLSSIANAILLDLESSTTSAAFIAINYQICTNESDNETSKNDEAPIFPRS